MYLKNLFDLRGMDLSEGECVSELFSGKGFRLERTVSKGHVTPKGQWCREPFDKWLAVIEGEGEIMYEDMSVDLLRRGDHVLIPADTRYRVTMTSHSPECVWLSVTVRG